MELRRLNNLANETKVLSFGSQSMLIPRDVPSALRRFDSRNLFADSPLWGGNTKTHALPQSIIELSHPKSGFENLRVNAMRSESLVENAL